MRAVQRALLDKCVGLLGRGVHPTAISDAMGKACEKACEILEGMSDPVDLEDRESLIQARDDESRVKGCGAIFQSVESDRGGLRAQGARR